MHPGKPNSVIYLIGVAWKKECNELGILSPTFDRFSWPNGQLWAHVGWFLRNLRRCHTGHWCRDQLTGWLIAEQALIGENLRQNQLFGLFPGLANLSVKYLLSHEQKHICQSSLICRADDDVDDGWKRVETCPPRSSADTWSGLSQMSLFSALSVDYNERLSLMKATLNKPTTKNPEIYEYTLTVIRITSCNFNIF